MLTYDQRLHRGNIRNAFMLSTIEELTAAKAHAHQNEYGRSVLQEMIDECKEQGVDSYGKTRAF